MTKQILVAQEKHGTYYYDASTPEELSKSALALLTERDAQGYWYHDPDKQDESAKEHGPKRLVETYLEDSWPGWDMPESERVIAINEFSKALKDKYGADPEVLELKQKNFKYAVQEYKHRREYRLWYTKMKDIVTSQDASQVVTYKSGRTSPVSWNLLDERSDHEYEYVTLENLQEVS